LRSIEHIKRLVRRYLEEVVNTGNVDHIEQFIAPDHVETDDRTVAFLVAGEPRGYGRGTAVDGPYGHPWGEARFVECFREHLGGSAEGVTT
jgi:hypothetical protein